MTEAWGVDQATDDGPVGPAFKAWGVAQVAAEVWTPDATRLGFTLQVRRDTKIPGAYRVWKVKNRWSDDG